MIDGKSQAWQDAADRLIAALARENKYIVGDMVIVFLESAGYGLDNYTPLGGVFKRAAKKGIIKKIDRNTKQALWVSQIYPVDNRYEEVTIQKRYLTELSKGQTVSFKGFPGISELTYKIVDIDGSTLKLEMDKKYE